MNVFDLPGPDFLVFYVLCAALVGGATWASLSLAYGNTDRRQGPALLADPYQIACLRGGLLEVARVAVFSLADQTLVELPRPGIIEPAPRPMPRGLNPVEQAILVNCPRPHGRINPILKSHAVRDACRAVREPLIAMGLAPSVQQNLTRAGFCALAGLFVIALGVTKLVIALERGRTNIEFLIALMGMVVLVFLVLALPRQRTPEGRQMLADLRRLLEARKSAVHPTSPSSEVLLLAGVYGSAGLAGAGDLQTIYQRAAWQPNGGGSCGSSSCGSGGCGGGGGCGGCGSG